MEHVGAISEREWNNYGGMHSSSTNEEADFIDQLLCNCSLPNENPSSPSFLASCWPVQGPGVEMASMEVTSMYSSNNSDDNSHNDVTNNMFYYFSQSGNEIYPKSDQDQPYVFVGGYNRKDIEVMENGDDLSNDSMEYLDEKKVDDPQNGFLGINLHLGMGHQVLHLPESLSADEKGSCPQEGISKKRPPAHGNVQKNKRSVKPKKNQRVALSSGTNGDNENNDNSPPILQRQNSTMSYCSEDESNASLEVSGGATTSSTSKNGGATNQTKGKTRASRGSATDPQSLYARKRREKINERLRILQSLVPNGTKVDISTMLEEAVQYVKFLQLQIKLLSSDDLWMYSPIAYNGMDMGLDLKIASHNL